MPLQPGNWFTVVRQIINGSDTDTLYVQAVIRNAYTDTTIVTVQLTDKGSQRFKVDWQVPKDPSGQGFYISIVTSVYTDSGYTTKSANYGDEENTYLIQERVLPFMRGGGGGVDAFTVRRIIKEELAKAAPDEEDAPAEEPMVAAKEPIDRTDEILQAIKENKPEPAQPTDLSPLVEAMRHLMTAVQEKEVTPPTDLQPILDAMQQKNETDGTDFKEVKQSLIATEEKLVQVVETTIKKAMDETEFSSTFTTRAQPKPAQKQQDQPQPFDIKHLGL